MPEILKKPNGDTDYGRVFMGFAAAAVLILQQWQAYKIAELNAEAEMKKVLFIDKKTLSEIRYSIESRLEKVEKQLKYIQKEIK